MVAQQWFTHKRVWEDTKHWLQNHIVAWFLAFLVPGGGTVIATLFIPPSMDIKLVALFGFIGGILGLLLMVGCAYGVNTLLVFRKQRDEMWNEKEDVTREKDKVSAELSSVKNELDTLRKMPATQVVMPSRYIPDRVISGRIIYLMDLLTPGGTRPIISNRTIEDCEVRGPATVFPNRTTISDCSFDAPDAESLFIEVSANRWLGGVIGLEDCTLRRCKFVGIGLIGTREQIEYAKKGFSTPTSHKEIKSDRETGSER